MTKRRLTPKQELFIAHYLDSLNGTEAARRAGYKGSVSVLGKTAFDNLRKPKIKEAIAEGMKKLAMPRDEVVVRLSMMASGILKTGAHDTKDGLMDRFDAIKALELLGKHYGLFTEKMILSWQEEAKEAGIPASVLFERMVAEIMKELQSAEN